MNTETEKRKHRCCFTGHRPESLKRSAKEIAADLEAEIRMAVKEGYTVFISGMARGVDVLAAEIVLKLRNSDANIKLICACPFVGFERSWGESWQERCRAIMSTADLVRYISTSYSRSCYHLRNEWMVDHSSRLIAVYDGKPSGTGNTVKYAVKQNILVKYIRP